MKNSVSYPHLRVETYTFKCCPRLLPSNILRHYVEAQTQIIFGRMSLNPSFLTCLSTATSPRCVASHAGDRLTRKPLVYLHLFDNLLLISSEICNKQANALKPFVIFLLGQSLFQLQSDFAVKERFCVLFGSEKRAHCNELD